MNLLIGSSCWTTSAVSNIVGSTIEDEGWTSSCDGGVEELQWKGETRSGWLNDRVRADVVGGSTAFEKSGARGAVDPHVDGVISTTIWTCKRKS